MIPEPSERINAMDSSEAAPGPDLIVDAKTVELLAREAGLQRFEVVIANDLQAWAHSVGLREDTPWRTAMAVQRNSDGMSIIAVAEQISAAARETVISGVEVRGFGRQVSILRDPAIFLAHLVFHEAAHLLLQNATEDECDQWAFERLHARCRVI